MKPTPRLTIHPMTPIPQPIADMAHTIASFGALILCVGGAMLLLFALAA